MTQELELETSSAGEQADVRHGPLVVDIAAGWLVAAVAAVVARATVEPATSGAYGRSSGPDQGPDREDP